MNTWKISIFMITILLSTVLFLENAHAVKFDRNECLAKIPKNADSITSNLMRKDCRLKEIHVVDEENRKKSSVYDPVVEYNLSAGTSFCADNYDTYKKKGANASREKMYEDIINDFISTEENVMFKRKLTENEKKEIAKQVKTSMYFDYGKKIELCLKLFKQVGDPNNFYNLKKLKEFVIANALNEMTPSTKTGPVNTDDLAAMAKRLDKLENENKKLKEQINQNKKK